VLIALLIFSFGVLGIVGLQANMSIRSTEARQRAEAAVLANEIIGRMWIAKAIDRDQYQYREDLDCEDDGAPDAPPAVLASWLEKLVATIPGAQARIAHDEPTGETELVICWQRPQANEWSQHVVRARINSSN
jgi:type IV pilus assembly protein PilV